MACEIAAAALKRPHTGDEEEEEESKTAVAAAAEAASASTSAPANSSSATQKASAESTSLMLELLQRPPDHMERQIKQGGCFRSAFGAGNQR